MLISVRKLETCWNVRARGVLHVGAHEAEELDAYEAATWGPVLWIEALPDKAAALTQKFQNSSTHRVVNAVVWHTDDEARDFLRTNNGQSSSLFQLGTHLTEHPTITVEATLSLRTSRLDTLLRDHPHAFDFVSLDIQGAELSALISLGARLLAVKWIYTEVCDRPLYVGAPLVGELDHFLAQFGFDRVDTVMTDHGWGDAIYVRRDVLPHACGLRRSIRRAWSRLERSRIVHLIRR